MLNKDSVLFSRDEKGNLIPLEVKLEIDEKIEEQNQYKGETIKIIPITREEIKKLFSSVGNEKDLDATIMEKYCVDPMFTKEEAKHSKPLETNIIVNTIFRESGLNIGTSKKKVLDK